jgi:hypothetical protein
MKVYRYFGREYFRLPANYAAIIILKPIIEFGCRY